MNWSKVSLSDLFQIGSSKRVLKSQWKSAGVPFYRGREITRLSADGFVENDLFITEEHFAELAKRAGVPRAGDIVITAIGTIGNSHVVRECDRFYFKDASVLWLQKITDVSSRFINLWLKSPLFLNQLNRGNGATVDTLTIQKLQSVQLTIPPLPEQHRIVAILDEALEGIATAADSAEKNLANARSVLWSYFHGILANQKYTIRQLGELCTKFEYGTSSKSDPEGKTPVLRMGNVQNGRFDWTNLAYSNDDEDIKKYLLRPNDVLFNRTNSPELVGKTAIYKGEQPAIFAGYLIRIHRNEELLDAEYLTHFLNSDPAKEYGKSVVISSVNQANINGSKLRTYPIPAPSLEEQRSIAKKFAELSAETEQLEAIYQQKLAALDELKKSILHRAFSGQLH